MIAAIGLPVRALLSSCLERFRRNGAKFEKNDKHVTLQRAHCFQRRPLYLQPPRFARFHPPRRALTAGVARKVVESHKYELLCSVALLSLLFKQSLVLKFRPAVLDLSEFLLTEEMGPRWGDMRSRVLHLHLAQHVAKDPIKSLNRT